MKQNKGSMNGTYIGIGIMHYQSNLSDMPVKVHLINDQLIIMYRPTYLDLAKVWYVDKVYELKESDPHQTMYDFFNKDHNIHTNYHVI